MLEVGEGLSGLLLPMRKLYILLAVLSLVALLVVLLEPTDEVEEVAGRMLPLNANRNEPYVLVKPLSLQLCPHVFSEMPRVDGRNVTLLVQLAREGRPFVAEGVIPLEAGKLDPLTSLDLAEEVKLSRFVRTLPITPSNSRLYPTDRVQGPLELFIKVRPLGRGTRGSLWMTG